MKLSYVRTHLPLLALALVCAAPPLMAAPAVTPTTSVEEAETKLAEVAAGRRATEALFATSERDCYTRFFVNRCLAKAKEIRHTELTGLRLIEAEASHFKRADAVERRDRALAEQEVKKSATAVVREAHPKVPHVEHAPAVPHVGSKNLQQKEAEHEAKVQKQAAREAALAGKRADNVVAFERKQAAAAERQRAVAAKLAARQAEADAKAQRAAAEAQKK